MYRRGEVEGEDESQSQEHEAGCKMTEGITTRQTKHTESDASTRLTPIPEPLPLSITGPKSCTSKSTSGFGLMCIVSAYVSTLGEYERGQFTRGLFINLDFRF